MICVDCDHTITGDYIIAAYGDSMSGARSDSYAHPPGTSDCKPRDRLRAAFRRALGTPKPSRRRRF